MTLDIGETQPLQRVEIVWEYPAKSFSLSVSSDGLSWSEVYATDVNGLQKTSVNLGHQSARKLRLIMREVHARRATLFGHLRAGAWFVRLTHHAACTLGMVYLE